MGIYVHIPFCRRKCFYCGFYSVASPALKTEYLSAMEREIDLRAGYLSSREVATLYLGGGTPSCLDDSQLERLISKIEHTWPIAAQAERTIEMNPEDAGPEKFRALRDLKFNRVSIGVQSFNDSILKRMNRQHSGQQAIAAVEGAAKAGFDNIGVDLIIGLPGSDFRDVRNDLKIINSLPVSHISVYILSIDSNSVLEKLLEKGKFQPEQDDILADRYLLVSEHLKDIGFEHYEISNFAKDCKYSVHNTAYWQQKEYIGLGAAAHSYNRVSRQWNVAHVKSYIDSLNEYRLNIEKEELTHADKYNEYIMTNLRTMWGGDVKELERLYPEAWQKAQRVLKSYIENGLIIYRDDRICLTERGWLISDRIFSSLFE